MTASPPLHQRIRGDIEARIRSGEWPPGYRVPFEAELMTEYGCARMTVSKAMSALADAGLI
ncbi:MAG: GntR family transcriptional regulator, partial [Phenylobacterium sp.]|nr:GntR family transcriptional regulator [Phenylobacterium sp.]